MKGCVKVVANGVVQGVGFRPFIYRLARDFKLNGSVQNTPRGVEIILDTTLKHAQLFIDAIKTHLPTLARLEMISMSIVDSAKKYSTFEILKSEQGESATQIPIDTAICTLCLQELFSPNSGYYLYPYVSCTHCGPRYSVIDALPYDRDKTTFNDFPLCSSCLAVYQDPLNRRYHAQTTVCEKCGPQLSHHFHEMSDILHQGRILALKSHNGFRLILNAQDEQAISLLRKRKFRPQKPFALMSLNMESIKQYVMVGDKESTLLHLPQRPIVLLSKKENCKLPSSLAPGLNELGFMLPATGLDYLLFYYLLGKPQGQQWLQQAHDLALIVTSANLSGGSIIANNMAAKEKLHFIADLIVDDNRKIAMQSDDSVMRVVANKSMMIRRSRGFTPTTLALKEKLPSVFAAGALLKNTFCFIDKSEAYLSQYIGDMDNQDSIEYFQKAFHHYQKLFGMKFSAVGCDLHPDFYTTSFVERLDLPLYKIQHHKAHAASVIAEHNIKGEALALILDGFGMGEDGVARGGELYHCNIAELSFKQIGELSPMIYLGGDRVQKEPWRMALSLCVELALSVPNYLLEHRNSKIFLDLLQQNSSSLPVTTSMGRLFDGISSLLDICHYNSFEGEAAMKLEALAITPVVDEALFKLNPNNQLDISWLIKALLSSSNQTQASNLFHGTLAYALSVWMDKNAQVKDIKQVILSGGCFQNKVLLTLLLAHLKERGLTVYIPESVPVNDGGVSLGQAWFAAKKYQKEKQNVFSNSCTSDCT
ncbi:carbamoyltransferase HypF [Fastidiosibacter lacustris]|uniref:carbamoyltransferase HypF n=1 Tax=Fastidiosibacter lacustris TaxID=2056695 RepID=UPI000E342D8F|nr:carbamoyltransferase HypF [Fastidiosibacter lacustris]